MQLSISYKREIEINARIRELSSKIINATESIATLKAEQEKLKRELK